MTIMPPVTSEEYILRDWVFSDDADDDALAMADTIRRWSVGEDWLDLGCGPMLSIWPMFSCSVKRVTGLDRLSEVLLFHKAMRGEELWPNLEGFKRAVSFYNKHFAGVCGLETREHTSLDLIQSVEMGDVTVARKSWRASFDTVVQVGCFGCLNSMESLRLAIKAVVEYLRPGGIFISATWLPRGGYLESNRWGGKELTNLSETTMVEEYLAAGLVIKERRLAALNQSNYIERYIFVLEKPCNRNII